MPIFGLISQTQNEGYFIIECTIGQQEKKAERAILYELKTCEIIVN